jgi:CO/xanthine dehydrogenase Mo-binding subunit
MSTTLERPANATRRPSATIGEKVRGEAEYTADLLPAGAAAIALVRSPHPHARIVGIDVERARASEGVLEILTGEHFAGFLLGDEIADQPVLAHEKVRYVGEAVVAVAARTAELARRGAAAVQVAYEVLPHAVSTDEALALAEPLHGDRPDNVARHIVVEHGDWAAAEAEAEHWAEGTFEIRAAHQGYMEPYAVYATFDETRRLVVIHTATHAPGPLQREYRHWFDRWGTDVQIRTPTIGGAFGAKYEHPLHVLCGEFARVLGRGVGVVLTRRDDFLIGNARQGVRIWARIGATSDGRLVAKESKVVADNGAYSMHGASVLMATMMRIENLWKMRAVRSEGRLVYTNTPGTQCQRGFGDPDAAFAQEQLVDELARRLGLAPAEIRRRNTIGSGETTLHGWRITSCEHVQCLDAIEASIQADRRSDPDPGDDRFAVGYGMASGMHTVGNRIMREPDSAEVRLRVTPDRVDLWAGEVDVGQGTVPLLAGMAADALGVARETVHVHLGDTEHGPFGHGSFSSRTTFFTGTALLDACGRVRQRTLDAQALGIEVPEIEVTGRFECETTDAYGPSGEGNRSPAYGFAAHGCRVRVDRWTGAIEVDRYWTMHDAGTVLWRPGAVGQVIGGVLQAAGQALWENVLRTPTGAMANPGFLDYRVPTSRDAIDVQVGFADSHDPAGPLGAKAIGELPLIPVAAAIANAVHDATGTRMMLAPMEPETVLTALLAAS